MTPTIFYLVRHGQTDWNVEKRLQGHADIPLNEEGRKEAARTGQSLSQINFQAVFASDLQRAVETAQIMSQNRPLSLKIDKRLRECDFGIFEGLEFIEFKNFIEQGFVSESVESNEEIEKRVLPFLDEIANLHPGGPILIVTHGGVMRVLIAKLQSIEPRSFFHIHVKNAAVLKIALIEGEYKIQAAEGIQIPQSSFAPI